MTGPAPDLSRFDLTGKVALVTGGSRGLGRAMALGLARAGADVAVASRRLDACQAVAAEIEALGRQALAAAVNVSHWDELAPLVDRVASTLGGLDVLVNNAGMSLPYEDVRDVTEAMWDKVLDLNLKGPFRLSVAAGTRMAEHGGGSIVNVSSTGSIRPNRAILPYAAAKAGLNSLTVGLAHTFGPTVRVNCVMAGPFYTDVTRHWDLEEFQAEARRRHALQRGGDPEEIVGAVVYLASDSASYTTGAVLRVDGGIP